MQTTTTNTGEPGDYGQLLLLQEVRSADGRVVQYFVCNDCLDVVEGKAGSIHDHDCPARASLLVETGGTEHKVSTLRPIMNQV